MLDALLPSALPAWVAGAGLGSLLYVAVVDARTGLVPPLPLAVASLLVFISSIEGRGAGSALDALAFAAAAYAAVWAVNELHYGFAGRDALGLGDAHWSFVATLLYGPVMVAMAWGLAAWLGLAWLGALRLAGRTAGQVYFVPFLMAALCAVVLMRGPV